MAGGRVVFDGPMVLDEITKFVRDLRHSGHAGDCPICGHLIKRYKRKLRWDMTAALRFIATREKGRVTSAEMKLRASGSASNDWTYLVSWGLINRPAKSGGHWEITDLGRQFLSGVARVPEAVFIENGERVGVTDEVVGIRNLVPKGVDVAEILLPWDPNGGPRSAQHSIPYSSPGSPAH